MLTNSSSFINLTDLLKFGQELVEVMFSCILFFHMVIETWKTSLTWFYGDFIFNVNRVNFDLEKSTFRLT